MKELCKLIEAQQKGHKDDPVFMIGEQLKEIAKREPATVEILKNDLTVSGMGLEGMANHLKNYADKNHGSKRCFCITPIVAEKLIRDFYKLPEAVPSEPTEEPKAIPVLEEPKSKPGFIDLSSFL